jgi:RsiW-degrading membrane proteinase PrsW (M82 family)
MKFLPLVVVHMYPELFQKATETISDMSKANYFYTTSYPTYGGYRIEHDPVFTAYIASTEAPSASDNPLSLNQPRTLLLIAVAVVIVIAILVVVFVGRKKI